jgi:hypothetical protein
MVRATLSYDEGWQIEEVRLGSALSTESLTMIKLIKSINN